MSMTYSDPFDVLLSPAAGPRSAAGERLVWDATTSMGSFPPINVFQQGDDFVAIIELPGVSKETSTFRRRISPKVEEAKPRVISVT